jgi:hypothetical protein
LHFSKVVSLHFDAGCVFVSWISLFLFFAGHVIPQRELAARQLWFGHENKYAYRIRQLVWFRHRALATTPWRVSLQYVSSTSSANELRTCKCRRRSAGTELKT